MISHSHRIIVTVAAVLGCLVISETNGEVLSDNLSGVTGGTETASGSAWLAAGFGTGPVTYNLNSVTLLLAGAGEAELDVYSDGGLEPSSPVGVLTSPSSYSGELTATTFTANGITLSPNTNYWVVLKSISGTFQWAWSTDNAGVGAGFQHTWGNADDAGLTWYTFDNYPTQFSVTATDTSIVAPTLTAAVSRRAHGGPTFDIPATLGPSVTAVEARRNGTDPQMVLTFSGAIEATDGSADCGGEVIVSKGTCNGLTISANTLTINMTFNQNQCVRVTLTGLRGAGGGLPITGVNTAGVLTHEGNANGDGSVNILDLQAAKNRLNQPLAADNFMWDVTCNGAINILDLQAIKSNLNHAAASCP